MAKKNTAIKLLIRNTVISIAYVAESHVKEKTNHFMKEL